MLDRYDQDLLLDYLEGELDESRRAQLDALLAEDPQLAGLLQEMAMDRAALRSLPEAQAPAGLVHDATHSLERRMLLDEPVQETGPIPMSRGRGLDREPTRSISWGRVVGLTGLAASVALAAGIVVITLDDPLERTADSLAQSPEAAAADAIGESAEFDPGPAIAHQPGGVAPEEHPNGSDLARIAEDLLTDPAEGVRENTQPGIDHEAVARALEGAPGTRDPLPPTATPRPGLPGEPEAEEPLANFAFGSTAAISVIQPRQQLVLLTESPEVSLEQLFEFCVANGIPIVQPDEQDRYKQADKLDFNSDPATNDEATATKDTDGSYGDYALLINERQLDTLVRDLNNDITLDPSRAGKASLLSNQAAVLTELPDADAVRYGADPRRARRAEQAGDDAPTDPAADQYADANAQQAIQLQLPQDLGSDYANTRNAYNLKQSQQQGGYIQKDKGPALAEAIGASAAEELDDAAAIDPKAGPLAEADKPETDLADAGVTKGDQPATAESANTEAERASAPGDAAFEFADANNAPAPTTTRIDPARGNWLGAYLPIAETTPLLLGWRSDQSARPTNLVPVTIQRAEPDKVNTLRKRQQVELANRADHAAAKTESQADQASETDQRDAEANAEPAAETQPSDEATPQPAKPAE